MKKNVLFMVAALLLCGAVSAQNWGTPYAHAKSSNTPIVARVTVDGNAVTPTADYRLGAFVGEELRGLAAPHTEDNNFWIQVFYNQGTSETISFKLYDGTNEYTTPLALSPKPPKKKVGAHPVNLWRWVLFRRR